jgi:hypothetical protein
MQCPASCRKWRIRACPFVHLNIRVYPDDYRIELSDRSGK